jgi:CBS domain-containing protein
MRVFDLMDPSPPTIEVPSERERLVQKFAALRVRGLAVVKAGTMKLAGMVLRAKLLEESDEDQVAFIMDPNPYTLYMQAPLREAAQALVRTELPLLPVVTGSNDLVGVVNTEACLNSLIENHGRVAPHLHRRLVPIHRLAPAAVAVRILRMTHASALPVLDDEAKLCGIVTDGDLLANAAEVRPGQPVRVPTAPVERFMIKPVVTVHTMSTVGEAAKIMLENGWHQLPVMDDRGDLVDLVTDHDLLGALL